MKAKSTVLPKLDPPAALIQARSTVLNLEARLAELSAVADGSERRAGDLHAQERELVDALTEARAEALARPGQEHAESITEIDGRLADVAERLAEIETEIAPHRRAVELVEGDLAAARQALQKAEDAALDGWHERATTQARQRITEALGAAYEAHLVRHPKDPFNPRDWQWFVAQFAPGLNDMAADSAARAATIRSSFDAPE